MDGYEALDLRIRALEATANQANQDSRTLIALASEVHQIKAQQKEQGEEIQLVRQGQGRTFIVGLVAACGSLGSIAGILIALNGGGP